MPIRKSQESVVVKRGITQNRPSSPITGDLYYDTTINNLIRYNGTAWVEIAPVPNAPTNVSATAGNAQATITFTAPTNTSVSSYTVTSSPGNITASGASSPITVTGLTNGASYTFTVTATNSNGISAASSASNSITATPPLTVQYVVIGGGGASGGSYPSYGNNGGAGSGGYRSSVIGESSGGGASAESPLSLSTSTNYTV
ncbi:MAG: hypothetical protein EB023_14980, partial [Flavobacteriia bacterium]|nr:hypothetical protein [Flavobacteriia bacterium]